MDLRCGAFKMASMPAPFRAEKQGKVYVVVDALGRKVRTSGRFKKPKDAWAQATALNHRKIRH